MFRVFHFRRQPVGRPAAVVSKFNNIDIAHTRIKKMRIKMNGSTVWLGAKFFINEGSTRFLWGGPRREIENASFAFLN